MNVYIKSGDITDMQWPCPDGFHVPTKDEWQAILDTGVSLGAWASSNGTNFSTYLKLPMAGRRFSSDIGLINRGSYGYYWSSTPNSADYAYILNFYSSNIFPQTYGNRSIGFPVRCFKNSPIIPTSSWTVLYQWSWNAWIFHNPTDWLISISSDGTTWYTLMDKNLWATTVYNYWDTLTEANCGKVYQRGNNYWFSWDENYDVSQISESSTQVDVTWYWPWNYYESSTWITTDPRQNSSNNWNNLRWWETWPVSMSEVQNMYIGEYVKPRTFTITWTETSNPASFNPVYSDDAAWLTAGSTAFDDFFGYYWCRLSNAGVETATENQSAGTLDITQLGTLTSWDNVMIAFPRRWIKMSKSWTTVTLSITEEPNKDWYQYYAHTKGSDAKDTLYLWAYKMVSWYKSLSWVTPLNYVSKSWFRQWVKSTYDSSAWTNRYSQITIYARWYINALYMMKYGNPNSQSVVGMWYVNWSGIVNTWGTNSQTNATYWTASKTTQCKLFWLEDWWWNICEFMECCWVNYSTQLTVDKTNSIFYDSDYSTNLWTASAWWLAWIDGSNDGMFRNVNTSWWGSTTYYTDISSAYKSMALEAGGNYGWDGNCGAFCLYDTSATGAGYTSGARLMYL